MTPSSPSHRHRRFFSIGLVSLALSSLLATADARAIFTIEPWELPNEGSEAAYPAFTAIVGDTVNFNYGSAGVTHDVFKHPGLSCEMRDIIRVKGANGPATYTFTRNDASQWGETIFFSCDVASHCELGQHVRVVVFETKEDRDTVQAGRNPVPDNPPPFIVVDEPEVVPTPAPVESGGSPNYRVNTFECNGANNKILRNTRLQKGEEIKLCLKVSSATKSNDVWIGNLESLEYNKAPYLSSSDAVKQVSVENGVVADNTSRVQCASGSELCHITTKLQDDFFNHDGEVQVVGVVSLQDGQNRRSMLRMTTIAIESVSGGDSINQRLLQTSAGFVDIAYSFEVGDGNTDNDEPVGQPVDNNNSRDSFDEDDVRSHFKEYQSYYIIGFIALVILMCCCIVLIIICCIIPGRNKRHYEGDTEVTNVEQKTYTTTIQEPMEEQAQPQRPRSSRAGMRNSNRNFAEEEPDYDYEYEYEEPEEQPRRGTSGRTFVDLNKQ